MLGPLENERLLKAPGPEVDTLKDLWVILTDMVEAGVEVRRPNQTEIQEGDKKLPQIKLLYKVLIFIYISGQQTFSVKDQLVNFFRFAVNLVSVSQLFNSVPLTLFPSGNHHTDACVYEFVLFA